jgi:hypothetical protein
MRGGADQSGFLPRLPWRIILIGLAIVGTIVTGYNWRQNQRAAELRVELRAAHGQTLARERAQYEAMRAKLATLISSAASGPTATLVDPTLNLNTLRDTRGLYLRLPLERATSSDQIAEATLAMEPDWIPSCLGLGPHTARELYEIGAFLLPAFVANLDNENVMKLRVLQDTLQRRMTQDMPNLQADLNAHWLMLVLQEGPSRTETPVRVFIWDLQSERLLLRARVQAQGILLSGRIRSQGLDAQASNTNVAASGAAAANDCSIASALKREAAARTAPAR